MSTKQKPIRSVITNDGLHYKNKVNGSQFVAGKYFGNTTMSCFLCGKHRDKTQLMTRKMFGKSQKVCSPNCKELEASLNLKR